MKKVTTEQAHKSKKVSDIVRASMTGQFNKTRLANFLGITPQALNSRLLHAESVKVSSASEMLSYIGFDLVAVPKGSNLPSGSYVVMS